MCIQSRQSCFVLLMTLVLLSVVAVTMVAVARRSFSAALRAHEQHTRLQHRWAVLTLESTLLDHAESILTDAEEDRFEPVAQLRFDVELAGQRYELLLADEQAKVNLNALRARRGHDQAEQLAGDLLAESQTLLRVMLTRPSPLAAGHAAFGSFQQIFSGDRVHPHELIGTRDAPRDVTSRVTCWGDGRLNLRRADPAGLAAVCQGVLGHGEVQEIIELRRDLPHLTIGMLARQLELDRKRQEKLNLILTDRSSCYSLWTVAPSDRVTRYRFTTTSPAGGENVMASSAARWSPGAAIDRSRSRTTLIW